MTTQAEELAMAILAAVGPEGALAVADAIATRDEHVRAALLWAVRVEYIRRQARRRLQQCDTEG